MPDLCDLLSRLQSDTQPVRHSAAGRIKGYPGGGTGGHVKTVWSNPRLINQNISPPLLCGAQQGIRRGRDARTHARTLEFNLERNDQCAASTPLRNTTPVSHCVQDPTAHAKVVQSDLQRSNQRAAMPSLHANQPAPRWKRDAGVLATTPQFKDNQYSANT